MGASSFRNKYALLDLRSFQTQELCEALIYLHSNGIAHGDVRGDNSLVSATLSAKLSGFSQLVLVGGEELYDAQYREGRLPTPAAWAAPELLEKHAKATFASDVFSFARTCVEVRNGTTLSFYVLIMPYRYTLDKNRSAI